MSGCVTPSPPRRNYTYGALVGTGHFSLDCKSTFVLAERVAASQYSLRCLENIPHADLASVTGIKKK